MATLADLQQGVNIGWMIYGGSLVFLMQAGFALLESGAVRSKNVLSILMKNIIDASLGATCWMLLGYGIAFGSKNDNEFLGTDNFVTGDRHLKEDITNYAFFFFQFTFCATDATIVSGAVAERCRLEGYMVMAALICAFIYPVVAHWVWCPGGALNDGSVGKLTDFAGSGVVHFSGGVMGLMGAIVLGPRKGRFSAARSETNAELVDLDDVVGKPSSVTHMALGTFMLWFGWYGFNAGSTVALNGSDGTALQAGRCAVCTTLAAAGGGITTFILMSLRAGHFDVPQYCNGILAGLVSITAGCNNTDPPAAYLVGMLGSFWYVGAVFLLERLEIDDPISAFPVHGACGVWGCIAIGLFDLDDGLFYSGNGKILGGNLKGLLLIAAWCSSTSFAGFWAFYKLGLLRVSDEVEDLGLDPSHFGEHGTPSGSRRGSLAGLEDGKPRYLVPEVLNS